MRCGGGSLLHFIVVTSGMSSEDHSKSYRSVRLLATPETGIAHIGAGHVVLLYS